MFLLQVSTSALFASAANRAGLGRRNLDEGGWGQNTKEYDPASELTYMYQRWYDPALGIFTSTAPYPPMIEHPYTFAEGNPVMNVDPDGEAAWIVIGAALGAGARMLGSAMRGGSSSDILMCGLKGAIEGAAIGIGGGIGLAAGKKVGAALLGSVAGGAVGGGASGLLPGGDPLIGAIGGGAGGALGWAGDTGGGNLAPMMCAIGDGTAVSLIDTIDGAKSRSPKCW